MREELIGYLLGALDAEEQARVEMALNESEQLRQELERLGSGLELLEADAAGFEPPPGLAARTCQTIEQRTAVSRKPAVPAASRPAPRDRLVSTGRWSLADMAVAAGVCAAAMLLFLPAIAQSRHQASLAYCQNNLRVLGAALTSYSESNGGLFPAIPTEGKCQVAGAFGPTIVEQGYLDDSRRLYCNRADRLASLQIPTLAEIEAAEGRELAEMLKMVGGDYGYVLGYIESGRLQPVRNERRPNFAILADAPNLDGPSRNSLNHGGCGQNVLFEDGHIRYVVGCQLGCGDHLFLNDAGLPEPGTHRDDSVIGPSSMPPIHHVRLRGDTQIDAP